MPSKRPSTKPPSADELFNNALPAFRKELRNLLDDSSTELRRRINEVITAKARLGKTDNPIHPRYPLYQEHATRMGEDFLSAFNNIIRRSCGVISNSSKRVLVRLLSEQYVAVINQRKRGLQRLAASLGRENQSEAIFGPARGIYSSSMTTCYNRLDAEIEKHNLEVGTRRTEIVSEEGSTPELKVEKYTPKHKVIKKGVNTMLEGLRLERPEATLDEAKRLYAHQVGDTYSSVNKAYHYKGKK